MVLGLSSEQLEEFKRAAREREAERLAHLAERRQAAQDVAQCAAQLLFGS
jgi:hypothetical protein